MVRDGIMMRNCTVLGIHVSPSNKVGSRIGA
jgi:hypothetical protein